MLESDPLGAHAVCALDYFETSIQNSLCEKVQRTVEPRGGKIDFDQPSKLVGDWIVPRNLEPDSMLAFVYDVNDPTQLRISIGGNLQPVPACMVSMATHLTLLQFRRIAAQLSTIFKK